MSNQNKTPKEILKTEENIKNIPELQESIKNSIKNTSVSIEEETPEYDVDVPLENILKEKKVVNQGMLETAKQYAKKGLKVCVVTSVDAFMDKGYLMNPNTDENTLYEVSTLLPCLYAQNETYFIPHQEDLKNGTINYLANDDSMLIPKVTIFKDKERNLLPKEDWYNVDVLVSSAPNFEAMKDEPFMRYVDYSYVRYKRFRRMLSLLIYENYDVVIFANYGRPETGNDIYSLIATLNEVLWGDMIYFKKAVVTLNEGEQEYFESIKDLLK